MHWHHGENRLPEVFIRGECLKRGPVRVLGTLLTQGELIMHGQPPDPPRVVLSVEAAADLLSISRTRMFALIKAGTVRSSRIGRLRRIPPESLAEYVDQLVRTQTNSRKESQV